MLDATRPFAADDPTRVFAARHWWGWLARGILAIVAGLIALVWPGIALLALALLVGVYFIISGVWEIYMGLQLRRLHKRLQL
jgi:uncharacterized membrane protein HdeD (DUF308 family)